MSHSIARSGGIESPTFAACAIAFASVSGLGTGPAARPMGSAGSSAAVAIQVDRALEQAGLARPFAARAPAVGAAGSDRAADLLEYALRALVSELDGKRPAGSVKSLLEQMRQQIGSQVLAFREACETGSRELLRQLDPEIIATDAGSSRVFFYKQCWEAFQARHDELSRGGTLFESYFDVAFQRAMRNLLKQAGQRRSDG